LALPRAAAQRRPQAEAAVPAMDQPGPALDEMEGRRGWYDPQMLASVRALSEGTAVASAKHGVRTISVAARELVSGMILHSNVVTKEGVMIIGAGHEINEMTLEKIQNFESMSGIREPIFIVDQNPPAK